MASTQPERRLSVETARHLASKFPHRRVAFAVGLLGQDIYHLRLCVEDEPGYHPLGWQLAWSKSERTMELHAEWLNEQAFDMGPRTASTLISTTMRRVAGER